MTQFLTLLLALTLSAPTVASQGKTYLTVKQALALAFPKCKIERTTIILDKKQCKRVAELSGRPFVRRLVIPYVARQKGKVVGTAYFDNHKVRTLKETLMVVVTPGGKIARIEILRFGEPKEYAPRKKWYAQFDKQKLDKDLSLKRNIRGITGASITARATTECARRVLALHKTITEKPQLAAKPQSAKRTVAGKSSATSRPVQATPKR